MRVGFFNYIHSLPLTLPFQNGNLPTPFSPFYGTPTQLNCMMEQNHLDISFVSSYFAQCKTLIPVCNKGICAFKKVDSVNLYFQGEVTSLNNAEIAVTEQSASSTVLLQILCRFLWKVHPCYTLIDRSQDFHSYRGLLLIGDEALNTPFLPGFTTIDLAAGWYELTGLPFVFGILATQKKISRWKGCGVK